MQITWTTETAAQTLSYKCPPEEQAVLVSLLPLSYLTAQLFDVWVSISVAGALYFAQPDALRVRQSSWVPCRGGRRGGWGGRPGGGGVTLSRGGLTPALESPPGAPPVAVRPWSFSPLRLSFPICKAKGVSGQELVSCRTGSVYLARLAARKFPVWIKK